VGCQVNFREVYSLSEETEAVSKDPWRLTPPKNNLNECHFSGFAKQNQKNGIHSLFYFAAKKGGEWLLRQPLTAPA
jgi:hypothetical protein